MVAIACVGKEVFALLGGECAEGFGYGFDEGIEGSSGVLAQMRFQLCDCLFDRIEVRRIGRQIAQARARGFNCLPDAGDLMAGEIVHDDDVARCKRRREDLLDISKKAITVHRAVENRRGSQAIKAQGSNEGDRFPMSPGHFVNQALAARGAPIASRHVGLGARLIDENEAFRIQFALSRTPGVTREGNVFAILFGGML